MTREENIDLYRLIGEELYIAYRRGALSLTHAYDTSDVKSDTNIGQLAKQTFVDPYLARIAEGESLGEEVQQVLTIIKTTISEYSRIKKEDEQQRQSDYSMSVGKALGRSRTNYDRF